MTPTATTSDAASDSEAARQALIEHHLPYARVVAASYYARRMHDEIEFDDYLQLATLGLVEAAQRFDPARGVGFRTFAARRMHGAILDGLERMTEKQQQIAAFQRARRERLALLKTEAHTKPDDPLAYLAELGIGVALGILLEGSGMIDLGPSQGQAEPAYRRLELAQRVRTLHEQVRELPAQQHDVIRRHYQQGQGFDDIARSLGLSKPRISQIHRAALEALRERLSRSAPMDAEF